MVFSPWVEPTIESVQAYEQSAASKYDILLGPLLRWGVDAYQPDDEILEDAQPYLCPLHHPFATKTPLFINAGAKEGIVHSIASFAADMSHVEGNRVKFHCSELMPHDFFLTYPLLGAKDTVSAVLEDAKNFLNKSMRD